MFTVKKKKKIYTENKNGFTFFFTQDNFVMLCPLHASHKLPNETCGSQLKQKNKSVPKRYECFFSFHFANFLF